MSGLAWSLVATLALAAWILFGLDGLHYYATPLAVRGYTAGHRLLRPSGPAGQTFGLAGAVLMLVPFLYMARKRLRRGPGTMRTWLEVHLFAGIVGPVLVTFHTSFKFNGIVSAAYWSMVIVVASGFLGRYLYVRIPRSIRGTEMTKAEIDSRVDALKDALMAAGVPHRAMTAIDMFEHSVVPAGRASWRDLLFGELSGRARVHALDRDLAGAEIPAARRKEIVRLTRERAVLMRRLLYLQRTKRLFDLWHVFHLPLVYILLVIVAAHVTVTMYMGYVPFRW